MFGSPLDFYQAYYTDAPRSAAYGNFCTRLFGRNFVQHGFADMAQVDLLLKTLNLSPADRVLEIGCGSGGISAYIAEVTGAHVTGIDFAQAAIAQAHLMRSDRLAFDVGDIAALPYANGDFTCIVSIDTLYFTDLETTIGKLKALLAPGGQMGLLYSCGADPGTPIAVFPREILPPDCTPPAVALQAHSLAYTALDVTAQDYAHAREKRRLLEEMHAAFEAEGMLWLLENRLGEACGVAAAFEAGAHARYLYHVRLPAETPFAA